MIEIITHQKGHIVAKISFEQYAKNALAEKIKKFPFKLASESKFCKVCIHVDH